MKDERLKEIKTAKNNLKIFVWDKLKEAQDTNKKLALIQEEMDKANKTIADLEKEEESLAVKKTGLKEVKETKTSKSN